MPSLPSFVELMASLGLEKAAPAPVVERTPSPAPSSSPSSPLTGSPDLPLTSRLTSASLRGIATHRTSRFSPYPHEMSFTKRRGSLSSVSSSDFEPSPIRATFSRSVASRPRRYRNKSAINTYGSSSDLDADTPISTYVRRRTPGASPTSPTFNADSGYESSEPIAIPLSVPSLPVLFPHSASSESFPNPLTDDAEMDDRSLSIPIGGNSPIDIKEGNYYRFISKRTGTRISTPPRSAELNSHRSRRKQTSELSS